MSPYSCGSCTLTWLHLVHDHVLWPVGDVRDGPERSVEGLHLIQRDVQHRVPGGVVQVDLQEAAIFINAATEGGGV